LVDKKEHKTIFGEEGINLPLSFEEKENVSKN
jgi:hypothetical protein